MKTEHDEKTKTVSVTFTHVPAEKWAYLETVAKAFNCTVGDMFGLFMNKLAATAGMCPPKAPSMVTNASRYSAVVTHLHKMEVAALKVVAWEAGSPSVPEYVLELIREKIDPLINMVPPMKGAAEKTDDATVLTDDDETLLKVAPLINKHKSAIRDGIGKLNLDRTPVATELPKTDPPKNHLRLLKN